METEVDVYGSAHRQQYNHFEHLYERNKRMKLSNDHKGDGTKKCVDYSIPSAFLDVLDNIRESKYGSVTPDIEALLARKMQLWNTYLTVFANDESRVSDTPILSKETSDALDLGVVSAANVVPSKPDVIIIESDDEDTAVPPPTNPFQEILLQQAEDLLKNSRVRFPYQRLKLL